MADAPDDLISFLFTSAVTELDIPDALAEAARRKYEEVGNWLGGIDEEWAISPQGSFRLGTVVQPRVSGADYDIDLACVWSGAAEDLDPAGLQGKDGDMLT